MLRSLIIKVKNKLTILKLLLTGFYKITKCPICGHWYLGKNSICKYCGYEYLYYGNDFETIEALKTKYNE